MELREIERSEFSQNGEDGIVAHLLSLVPDLPRDFLEIGSGSGKENNTRALLARGWTGVMVDRQATRIRNLQARNLAGLTAICLTVTPTNVRHVLRPSGRHLGLLSLDIDSCDWHVLQAIMWRKVRPGILVLEYNATFGDLPLAVPHPFPKAPAGRLKDIYYGCGVQAWRFLLEPFRYRLVTVDSQGVNAIFVDRDRFPEDLGFSGALDWVDNAHAVRRFGQDWRGRLARIIGARMPVLDVTRGREVLL